MTVNIEQNVALAPFTTIGIGGPARYFASVSDVDALREALDWARDNAQPVFILGGGSNLLISDDGFPGLVIRNRLLGIVVQAEDPAHVIVRANAGEPWDPFVEYAVMNGWAGVECLSGIPGLVGATPIQNVGAYGQDVSETIIRVEVLDRTDGRVKTLTNWDCRFGYRSSLFKDFERERYVVTGVTFRLRRNAEAAVKYPELRRYLDENGIALDDLPAVRAAVITIRKRKGMVLDPADADTRSDGSFFMNPIVDAATAGALAHAHEGMPAFPANDGTVKLSAAWLIEQAGFTKGFTLGNAGLSTKHTLAVVNRGSASAAEVIALVELIQSRVREAFGVELHPEPNFIGF
jgi:UDP-N-acetylmuramate dehydrogenase